MTRPNILFLFSDQQRWDTCGCYGQPLPVTPHLDAMAAAGVRCEHAFTCQPVCGPARAVLQTGLYATQVGCHTNHRMLPLDVPTVAKALTAAGYECGYLGKWHLASRGERGGPDDFRERGVPPERRGGYDDFWLASDVLEFTSHSYDGHMFAADGSKREFPAERYRADVQTDWLLEYLDARTGEKPWFMFCSWIEPHHQNDHHHFEGPHGSKERWEDFPVPGDLVDTGGDWREEYPDYLGCCNALDNGLGRILARLEDMGVAEDTLVIYTSDHGSHFCTRNGEYKRSCHDGCIRIPLVLRGPGFTGGQVPAGIASLVDLPPTVLRAAGVDPLPGMQGRPLQDLVAGAAGWPAEAFLQISESQCGRAIRTARWTYSVRAPDENLGEFGHRQPASEVYREDFLYDNDADPHQKNNLVADPAFAEVRAELKATLLRRMAAAGEDRPTIIPA